MSDLARDSVTGLLPTAEPLRVSGHSPCDPSRETSALRLEGPWPRAPHLGMHPDGARMRYDIPWIKDWRTITGRTLAEGMQAHATALANAGIRPFPRVLALGDDTQLDAPRMAEFWRHPSSFGVVEEWVGWIAIRGISPLSDLSLAGLRGLIEEYKTIKDEPPQGIEARSAETSGSHSSSQGADHD